MDRAFMKYPDVVALCVIGLIGIVYWATLIGGVGWGGGDYASYIWNARNLLEGREIGDVPFIPNYQTQSGIAVVPPLFPLSLALPIGLFGADLETLKLYNIGFLLAFFFLAFKFTQTEAKTTSLFLLVALATTPLLWNLRGTLMSEFLFLSLLMGAFLVWSRLYKPRDVEIKPSTLALGVVLVSAVVLTRVAGIALLPAVFFAGAWAERAISPKTVILTSAILLSLCYLVFGIGIFAQYGSEFLQPTGDDETVSSISVDQRISTTQVVLTTLKQIPDRARSAIGQLSTLWTKGIQQNDSFAHGWPGQYQKVVTALLLVFGAAGFLARVLRGPALAEWFTAGYSAMMLLMPAYLSAGRMFLPVSVMLVFYAFCAVEVVARKLPHRLRFLPPVALLSLILSSSALAFIAMDPEKWSLDERSTDPRAMTFFSEVRRVVPEDAVMIGYRPRGVAFFTDRTATDYHHRAAGLGFWTWAKSVGAEYLYFDVADHRAKRYLEASGQPGKTVSQYARFFLGQDVERLELLYDNERFQLYRLRSPSILEQFPVENKAELLNSSLNSSRSDRSAVFTRYRIEKGRPDA